MITKELAAFYNRSNGNLQRRRITRSRNLFRS